MSQMNQQRGDAVDLFSIYVEDKKKKKAHGGHTIVFKTRFEWHHLTVTYHDDLCMEKHAGVGHLIEWATTPGTRHDDNRSGEEVRVMGVVEMASV
jgi:hypothetical protein